MSAEKNIVIFDLDGTLANIEDRLKKSSMKNGKINWKRFFSDELIKDDLPNVPVIKTANLFHQNGFKIYIFSGRSDKTSDITSIANTYTKTCACICPLFLFMF